MTRTRTALLLLAAAAIAAVATTGVVLSQTPSERVVRITAKRFVYDPEEVTVTRGVPVVLELVSLDRTHGFRIPALGVHAEITEGETTRVRFVPERAGRFTFLCDVFCGSGHEEMEAAIVVTEP